VLGPKYRAAPRAVPPSSAALCPINRVA
jgi:hypothetical protein